MVAEKVETRPPSSGVSIEKVIADLQSISEDYLDLIMDHLRHLDGNAVKDAELWVKGGLPEDEVLKLANLYTDQTGTRLVYRTAIAVIGMLNANPVDSDDSVGVGNNEKQIRYIGDMRSYVEER